MEIQNEIIFPSKCLHDNIGRVFFYKDRVFRTIDKSYVSDTLEFLNSPLYTKLLSEGQIVRSCVTTEFNIPAYPLILEHERICPPHGSLTFSDMKDRLLFTIQLQRVCQEYGYILKDAKFDNVTWVNERLCLIDFLSIEKDMGQLVGRDEQIAYRMLLPMLFLSKTAMPSLKMADVYEQLLFSSKFHHRNPWHIISRKYIKKYIRHFEIKWRHGLGVTHVNSYWMLWIINHLDELVKKMLGKPYSWHLFTTHPVYSLDKIEKECRSLSFKAFSNYTVTTFHIEQISSILKDMSNITIIGNIDISNVITLSSCINAHITVVSPCSSYTEDLYLHPSTSHSKIQVALCNIWEEDIESFSSQAVLICSDILANRGDVRVDAICQLLSKISETLICSSDNTLLTYNQYLKLYYEENPSIIGELTILKKTANKSF